jgi:hypothetical protein
MLEKKDFIISCKFDQQDSNSVIGEKTAVSTDFFDNTYKQLFSAVSPIYRAPTA